MKESRLLIRILTCFFSYLVLSINVGFSQDTIKYSSNLNLSTNLELKSAIELYQKYVSDLESGEIDYKDYWIEKELKKYKVPDLATHYLLPKKDITILGVSKADSNRYVLKTLGYMNKQGDEPSEIMYIYNYVVYRENGKYKLGNYLHYSLAKRNIKPIVGEFGEYYGFDANQAEEIDELLREIEIFFDKKFDVRFKVFDFADNLESLSSRGYDYLIGSMNSKTTTSGLYNPSNNVMYTTGKGRIHKHEILRSLHTLLPESPIILRNGLANLIGGSLGLSLRDNVKLLYPFLKNNPTVLNEIDDFYKTCLTTQKSLAFGM